MAVWQEVWEVIKEWERTEQEVGRCCGWLLGGLWLAMSRVMVALERAWCIVRGRCGWCVMDCVHVFAHAS